MEEVTGFINYDNLSTLFKLGTLISSARWTSRNCSSYSPTLIFPKITPTLVFGSTGNMSTITALTLGGD